MNRTLLIITLMMSFVSCVSSGQPEKDRQDSIRQSDSIAQVQSIQLAIEQARADSIMQDSIRQAEKDAEAFIAALPNPKLFLPDQYLDYDKYLKSLGYKGSSATVNTLDGEETTWNYSYYGGEKSIKLIYTRLLGGITLRVTIDGDQEACDTYYKKARKFHGSGDYWNFTVTQKGNTVIIDGGME